MTIMRGDKELLPYLGDYSPVNVYKGTTKLAGWKWESQSGTILKFENGYKTPIYTDKADDAIVRVEVDGKSEQNAGSGKNVFEDKYLSNRDNFILATYSIPKKATNLKGSTRYILSAKKVVAPELGKQFVLNIHDGTNGIVKWREPNWDSSIIMSAYNMNSTTVKITDRDNLRAGFTTPESGLIYFSYYEMKNGLAPEGDWFTDRMIEPQLEEGSTATPYEPPAPSPDNPIPINSLDKSFDIVSSVGGRNLIPPFTNPKWSVGGAKIDKYNMSVASGVGGSGFIYIDVKPNTSYTVTFNSDYMRYYIYPFGYTSANDFIRTITEGSDKFTFNTGSLSKLHININTWSQRISYDRSVWDFSLVENGENSVFTPAPEDIAYDTQTPTLYKTNILLSEPLRSIGDVKDKLFLDTDGLWKVERNVGEKILDSNTQIITSGAPNYEGKLSTNRYLNILGLYGRPDGIFEYCSHVIHKDAVWRDDSYICGTTVNAGTQFHIRLTNDVTGVLETDSMGIRNIKWGKFFDSEKLKGTPFTIQYCLATPTIETLPQSEQVKLNNIQSFKGTNYVYTLDKIGILEPNLNGKMKVQDI